MTQREKDLQDIDRARDLEQRLTETVREDFPDLCGWAMRREAIVRTGPGAQDWRWDGSVRGRAKRARQYIEQAVGVAASRISQAYGLGAGSEWAARRFGSAPDWTEQAAISSHTG